LGSRAVAVADGGEGDSTAVEITGRERSVCSLMRTPMVCTTVEHLIRREAFAAWEVHPALRTTHHVFCTLHRFLRAVLDLALVTLEYPVGERKPEDKKEDLGQAAVR
jgi:hypothetical protein